MSDRVRRDRVEALAEALSRVSPGAVEVIELSDPQYGAVRRIAKRHGGPGVALVVANALVSYKLSLPGEEYWNEFADAAVEAETPRTSDDVIAFMERFLSSSKGNRVLVAQKLSRIRRAKSVLEVLVKQPDTYTMLSRLVGDLSRSLGGRGDEKTIVFAAKMAYYYYRALGLDADTHGIPLPIDRRMALLTSTSRLIEAPPSRIMTRLRREALQAWSMVADSSGIGMLHLDALVWLPAYRIEKLIQRGINIAREEYARRLVEYSRGSIPWSLARRLAREILYAEPVPEERAS